MISKGMDRQGWMSFVLKEKLKGLKFIIKEWHKGVYGDMEASVSKRVEDILELDVRGEEVGLSEEEVELRKSLFRDLWRLLRAKDSNMVQRARSKLFKEGDTNSKNFHKCVKIRNSGNSIKALRVGEEWVQSLTDVRRVVVDYFTNHVAAHSWERLKLDGVSFQSLREEDNLSLVAPLSMEEIEKVVKDSEVDKKARDRMDLILLLLKAFGI